MLSFKELLCDSYQFSKLLLFCSAFSLRSVYSSNLYIVGVLVCFFFAYCHKSSLPKQVVSYPIKLVVVGPKF